MTRYTAPKTITRHPGVEECLSAVAGGCDESEYTHDVFLREGWVFKHGRNAGCRGCHFKTVRDFLQAEPTRVIESEVERRWSGVSYEARVRLLERAGHATGFAGHNWRELNSEIQADITSTLAAA